MFANQFRKITPFSLLLGGFLNAIVLFSIFSMENREIPFSSVFLTPLLLWVVCMLFCYELIWLESKRIVFYFKGFHFVTLSTALLVYPFETIAIDLVVCNVCRYSFCSSYYSSKIYPGRRSKSFFLT